ncbi:MAG TPA: AI-2E family transporter [Polyangiaceae bacterium]|nr:AI-2E family transporter [Polyangiaceae bacterium]
MDRQHALHGALVWAVLVLCGLAFFTLRPLWAPLLLAAWSALLAQPLHQRLMRVTGRSRAAGIVTVLLVIAALTPIVVVVLSVVGALVDLAERLRVSEGEDLLGALLATEPQIPLERLDLRQALEIARRHGSGAVRAASTVFGAATALVIGLFVFVFGFYTLLVDGRRAYGWLIEHSPVRRRYLIRFADAFAETGRGLFIGMGLTALIQGALATIGYALVGAPQALVLGLLTTLASFIPTVGTGLVWVPVTVALFVSGRTGSAVALLVVGAVVSLIDNFVRPWLSRYGQLRLPTFVVFLAMLGGIGAFGAWGLLLGPLLVRLALEALEIWREEQEPKPIVRAP